MRRALRVAFWPAALGEDELRRCAELLEALVADRALLSLLPDELRVRLATAAGRLSRPNKFDLLAKNKAVRQLRKSLREARNRAAVATTEIRVARKAPVYVSPAPRNEECVSAVPGPLPYGPAPRGSSSTATDGPELATARACYVCKVEFHRLHFFYDALCPDCAAFNYEKRNQSADLSGRVALVTGARVKIGFQAALKLLRAGATVVSVTRFPHDAARRYAAEPDFPAWKERLHLHGLDLRHSPSVEILARFLERSLPRLDILINNACQTVRRPAGWHAPLLPVEEAPAAAGLRPLLAQREALLGALGHNEAQTPAGTDLVALQDGGIGIGIRQPAQLALRRYTYDDAACGKDVFPDGRLDADLQQVDLRRVNSWRMTLAEVSTPELLEVALINAVAPFILCARLKPLMERTPGAKQIVNVSAMEGVFSRGTKTDKHPHTNMAKAALNMMTRTSAPDYAKDSIYMNAVDTGWVTDEDPVQHAERKRTELNFEPPLDVVDGAARVLDPIFACERTGAPVYGKFLKDYKPSTW